MLQDMATNTDLPSDARGVAAHKCLALWGEVAPVLVGRPRKDGKAASDADAPLTQGALMVTWHGDFGAVSLQDACMDCAAIEDLTLLAKSHVQVCHVVAP